MNNILNFLKNMNLSKLRRLSVLSVILWAVVVAAALALFLFARGFTACWQLTSLPGLPPDSCNSASVDPLGTPVLNLQGTPLAAPPPVQAAPVVEAPTWDGGSRINILFFGLRAGGGAISGSDCPLCTDTLIVATIDPVSKTAGMLSVPRDLFVNIPGFGYSRINTAYTNGEAAKLPGGGPGLAMKTVSQATGVPIQYYITVDFSTFVNAINDIGGVDVYVSHKLNLDPQGTGLDHVVVTCCGIRHLSGQVALAYARTRDLTQGAVNGDIGRSQRQQQIIFAIRDKILSPSYFPQFIAQAPTLYKKFAAGIHTNLTLDEAIKIAYLVKDLPKNQIQTGQIDFSMVAPASVTLAGQPASVLIPYPDKIRVEVDRIFLQGGPTSPIAGGDEVNLMRADAARVTVLNGTYAARLDARTANYLQKGGVTVIGINNAPQTYASTTLIVYTPKLYTLRYLIKAFGISSSNQIYIKPNAASQVDIEVLLGSDWISKLPPGY
jgi:polyisoprenyl-teichoic acid--peptidoglycan teichoic acid transferase